MKRGWIIGGGGTAALVAAGAVCWAAFGGDGGPHVPPKTIVVAPPALPSTGPTPNPVTVKAQHGPVSTSSPRGGNGLGAPDQLSGRPGPQAVSLTWRRVAGAQGYVIYRDAKEVGRTTGLSFDDTNLRPGTQHTWTVAALDASNAPGDRSTPYTGAASKA